jgi:hypothetical protein
MALVEVSEFALIKKGHARAPRLSESRGCGDGENHDEKYDPAHVVTS